MEQVSDEWNTLTIDVRRNALPELQVSAIKALPALRPTVSDPLATAQGELAGAIK